MATTTSTIRGDGSTTGQLTEPNGKAATLSFGCPECGADQSVWATAPVGARLREGRPFRWLCSSCGAPVTVHVEGSP